MIWTTLRRLREQRGWSQAHLAGHLGTDARTVSRWERGVTTPSPHFRTLLCHLFQTTTDALGLTESLAPSSSLHQARCFPLLDPTPPDLQIPAAQIIGRDAVLIDLIGFLERGTSCVLYGLPGVGKTTIAQLISRHPQVQTLFPDGLLWASLGPAADSQSELLRWATLLQVPEDERLNAHRTEALSHLLHHVLRQRRLLLVLDDAWSVETLRPLLIGGPHVAHLVTTRLPELALSLPHAHPYQLPELDEGQSRTLLTHLVPTLTSLAEDGEAMVRQVLLATGGLPLAVALLGYSLRKQTVGGQRRRLATALARLTDPAERLSLSVPPGAAPPSALPTTQTSQSLQTLIEISTHHLPPRAREGLYALGILPAKPYSFSEAAALAVCGQGLEVLDQLLDIGLVEGAGEGRYRMHQVIADYARLQQQAEGPKQRLVEYGHRVCSSLEVNWKLPVQDMHNEYPVLQAALQTAISLGQNQEGLYIIQSLRPFWRTQGRYEQANDVLHLVLSVSTLTSEERARLLADRASFACLREAWEQARQEALAARDLLVDARLQEEIRASCLLTLGQVAEHEDHHAQAALLYEEGLQLARVGTDQEMRGHFLAKLGNQAMKQGEYARAKDLYNEGLTWARQEGHLELLCRMLSNLGHTLRLEGDYPQAERWLREGLALARHLTYQNEHISLLLNLGVTVCQQGAIAQGAVFFVEGLALARQSSEHRKIKQFLLNLGAVAMEQQDYEQAERYLQEGLVEARQTGDTTSCIVLLTNLGTVLAMRGRWQEAQTAFEEGVQFARKQSDPWLLSNALGRRADASLLADHVKEAEQGFEASLAVYQDREPNRELATMARFGLAQVMARCGKREEARQQAEQCLQTFVEMHHRCAEEVHAWLAQLSQQVVKEEEAVVNQQEVESTVQVQVGERCLACGSTEVAKRGKGASGRQRYQCRVCRRAFTASLDAAVQQSRQAVARDLVVQGKSLRAVARHLGVSHATVKAWVMSSTGSRASS